MGTKMIPSVYVKVKNFTQSYEARKRIIEQMSGLAPDKARDQVLLLAHNVISELSSLGDRIEQGEFDTRGGV